MRRILCHRPSTRNTLSFLTIITLLTLASVIIAGYYYGWAWTGLSDYTRSKTDTEEFQRGKTLWDWMQLLIIPAVLAVAAVWFNRQEKATERELAEDRQREDALQAYLDTMSDLLLNHNLRDSAENAEVRQVARARTLTVIKSLDAERKVVVLKFLYEANLITRGKTVVSLQGANLDSVNLKGEYLDRIDLRWTDLRGADLRKAYLAEANLVVAHLQEADLRGAILRGADLNGADLESVNLEGANLEGATLQGTKVTLEQLKQTRPSNNSGTNSVPNDLEGVALHLNNQSTLPTTSARRSGDEQPSR